MATPYQNPITN